jgi:hypothetical protein
MDAKLGFATIPEPQTRRRSGSIQPAAKQKNLALFSLSFKEKYAHIYKGWKRCERKVIRPFRNEEKLSDGHA